MKKSDIHNYNDIINRKPPIKKHPAMDRVKRAAQFAPFAALTGYQEIITESGKYVEDKRILDENKKEQLDQKLKQLIKIIDRKPQVKITHFVQDQSKLGGTYITSIYTLVKVDENEHILHFDEGNIIAMSDVFEME